MCARAYRTLIHSMRCHSSKQLNRARDVRRGAQEDSWKLILEAVCKIGSSSKMILPMMACVFMIQPTSTCKWWYCERRLQCSMVNNCVCDTIKCRRRHSSRRVKWACKGFGWWASSREADMVAAIGASLACRPGSLATKHRFEPYHVGVMEAYNRQVRLHVPRTYN